MTFGESNGQAANDVTRDLENQTHDAQYAIS